ncbi:hypothetical protein EI94DRAFT_1750633 [Lactarius quietus]|nr:hypothetical protein EI94DRAFT_1750633 [Lactarius quietus]
MWPPSRCRRHFVVTAAIAAWLPSSFVVLLSRPHTSCRDSVISDTHCRIDVLLTFARPMISIGSESLEVDEGVVGCPME